MHNEPTEEPVPDSDSRTTIPSPPPRMTPRPFEAVREEAMHIERDGEPKPLGKVPQGFAAMTPEQRIEAARKGGLAAHAQGRAHQFTPEEARAAGAKGGTATSQDRERMAALGRKGGAAVSANREHMSAIGRRGGLAVSRDPEHMSRLGRRGAAAAIANRATRSS